MSGEPEESELLSSTTNATYISARSAVVVIKKMVMQ